MAAKKKTVKSRKASVLYQLEQITKQLKAMVELQERNTTEYLRVSKWQRASIRLTAGVAEFKLVEPKEGEIQFVDLAEEPKPADPSQEPAPR